MIVVAIDGTGVFDDAQYRREMRHSFVSYISQNSPFRHVRYWRGPAVEGSDCPFLVSEAYTWVDMLRTEDREGVLLAGYSRGAACVVAIAQRLQSDDVRVNAMMLFDCVDRAVGIDTARIPNNVDEVLHVRRSPLARSRESFSNSGTVSSAPTVYNEHFFMGTHGAMGGVPWHNYYEDLYIHEGGLDGATAITFRRDRACAREIWNFIRDDLRRMRFIR